PRPTFNGSGAEPGSTINVYDDGVLIGTTTANPDGTWSFTPSSDLADGEHSLTFSVVDAAGNEGPESTPFELTVSAAPPAAPTVGTVVDDIGTITDPLDNGDA